MSWRQLFPLVFLYSLVEGFVQHKLYLTPLPTLFKDFILIFIYMFFVIGKDPAGILYNNLKFYLGPAVVNSLMAFLFIGIIQIFNPRSPGLVLGLLGFKVYYLYIPLTLLGYAYVDRPETMRRFLAVIAYASIPINIFGLVQFFKGPEYIMSLGPGFYRALTMAAIDKSGVESFARIFGTFSSTGIYSNFIGMNIMICFALIFSSQRNAEKLKWVMVLNLSFICLLAAGSRGALLFLAVQLLVLANFSKEFKSIMFALIISGIGLFMGFHFLGKGVAARFETLKDVKTVQERAFTATHSLFLDQLNRNPMGRGIGAASIGARHLSKKLNPKVIFVENFPTKLQVEFGIIGVIIFYLFLVSLLGRWIFDWIPVLKDSSVSSLALPISVFCICYFFVNSIFAILDSPPCYFFIWAFMGMVIKLKEIAAIEKAHYQY